MPRLIEKNRRFANRSKEALDRARHLYVMFCRQAIALDRSGKTLKVCAARMIESGLYKYKRVFGAEYAILRKLWNWDKKQSGLLWHEWRERNGWDWGWRTNGVIRGIKTENPKN